MNVNVGNAKTTPVHITTITAGDTIVHNNQLTTVCENNIHRCLFMGTSLFGDNYKSGNKPVQKVVAWINGDREIPVKK